MCIYQENWDSSSNDLSIYISINDLISGILPFTEYMDLHKFGSRISHKSCCLTHTHTHTHTYTHKHTQTHTHIYIYIHTYIYIYIVLCILEIPIFRTFNQINNTFNTFSWWFWYKCTSHEGVQTHLGGCLMHSQSKIDSHHCQYISNMTITKICWEHR